MRLGFFLPNVGPWAGPESVAAVAKRAEELAYDSVWVTERLLFPLEPSAPYPVADGVIPDVYKTVLEPLDTLGYVAGRTDRVGLGVSVLNLPWYNPVLLARRLTTLDVLSKGRLQVGFGIGWSPEEHAAAGSSWTKRGKRADEALEVMKAIWASDPVEFEGEFFRVPRSIIGVKPVQKPHPPISMAAYTPGAMSRLARHADAWNPVGIPLAAIPEMYAGIQALVEQAGRDPSALGIVMRANAEVTEQPLGDDRASFCGTTEQIAADIAQTREIGATDLIIDPTFDPAVGSADDMLGRMELFKGLAS